MDAVSYSHADKQKQRIEKFIKQPDSTSGIVTVPDTIASGESIEIATGRQIVVDHLDVQGTLDIQGTLATVTGGYLSQTTMKTQAIAHTNGTNAMTIDSSGNVMLGSNYLTPYTGFKNRIINGAMMIDQRNAGASVSVQTSTSYTLDRWVVGVSQNSKFSLQQNAGSVTPPSGFVNYLGCTSSSAYSIGSTDFFAVGQRIEGLNLSDLGWGTINAQTVTLSFKVYSSLTGTFGGVLQNYDGTRSYPFSYSIQVANTWTSISVTIQGDTSGTWLKTNGIGITLWFGLGVGATYSTTAGSWAAGNYISCTGATSVVGTNGATFYITGVQLEKGSVATPFEQRPYGLELSLCERTLPSSNGFFSGYAATTNEVWISVPHKVKARVVPTGLIASSGGTVYYGNTGSPITGITFFGGAIDSSTIKVNPTGSPLTVGQGVMVGLPKTLFIGCEL